MTATRAFAAQSSSSPLAAHTIDRREPGPHDVKIEILYCGVCHSDLHTARGEWARHEISVRAGPRDRRQGDRGRRACDQVQGRPARRRRLHGRQLRRVRELQGRARAILLRRATSAPTTATTSIRAATPSAATPRRSRSTSTSCCRSPTTCRSTPPRRCSAPESRSTRR